MITRGEQNEEMPMVFLTGWLVRLVQNFTHFTLFRDLIILIF